MKTGRLAAYVAVLAGCLMSAPGLQAAEPDEALCRGSYPVMLMTDVECRLYIRQVQALRAQGRTRALAALQRQHDEQLRERAAICLCLEGKPEVAAPQLVVLLDDSGC